MLEIREIENMVAVNSYRLEILIRDSERLAMVQEYVMKADYVNTKDLKVLLGIDARQKMEEAIQKEGEI